MVPTLIIWIDFVCTIVVLYNIYHPMQRSSGIALICHLDMSQIWRHYRASRGTFNFSKLQSAHCLCLFAMISWNNMTKRKAWWKQIIWHPDLLWSGNWIQGQVLELKNNIGRAFISEADDAIDGYWCSRTHRVIESRLAGGRDEAFVKENIIKAWIHCQEQRIKLLYRNSLGTQ